MKKLVLALSAFALAASALWAVANPTEALVERISSKAQVCVAGQDCSAEGMAASAQLASASARSGQEVYDQSCAACHNSGAAGAPRMGASEWQTRYDEKGFDMLVANSISGIGAMPPRGGCADCSDEEIEASVQYIIDESI
ncbi:MAG: c-type cytochrome [Natronospirillum sp.]|uniref:c-type cytochrome n=1 Tax=Natronospirillum sp. TaxID=2812955 RepID=UPI0025E51336|nr:c-type cytochrome [Natronospirillum sp.]MCH8551637.1 c-type cytochrome [Natronospirillum sp.]